MVFGVFLGVKEERVRLAYVVYVAEIGGLGVNCGVEILRWASLGVFAGWCGCCWNVPKVQKNIKKYAKHFKTYTKNIEREVVFQQKIA